MPRYRWLAVLLTAALFVVSCSAAEDTTQKTEKATNTTSGSNNATATTTAPKINVMESDLCKKCACITDPPDFNQIDCSNRSMSNLFSAEEWKILQNGDIIFSIIKLQHNNITAVPQLPDYPAKNLYLGFNQIASIEVAAFRNFSALEQLDLSHNKLTSKTLIPDVFKGTYAASDYLPLKKMRTLDLGYNNLHHLDDDLFEHVPNLEVLILCGNTFQVLDHSTVVAISGLHSMKTLDLSFMELKELPDNLLHGPRELQTLILSGNLFDEMPADLEMAINLQELVLDENLIEELSGDNILPNLPQLRYLSVSYMPELKSVGSGAFGNLQNLTTLIMASNPKLEHIDTKAFAHNTTIDSIYAYPHLHELHLHNNNLTRLEFELLDRWDLVTTLDLRFNPWICDCENRWLIHTLVPRINSTKPQMVQDVLCYQPAAWTGVPLSALGTTQRPLKCSSNNVHSGDSLFLIGLLVGLLVCIPIILGSVALWRRGCFGLNRQVAGGNRALYNRADFSDDLHI